MHVISDCRYFEFAVNSVFINENRISHEHEKLVIVDMRYLSFPEEAFKKFMNVSNVFIAHHFVLVGNKSLFPPDFYDSHFFIDSSMSMTDFVDRLLRLSREKISVDQYCARLTGLIHHKDASQGILLTNMERKIRTLVFKNLPVANMASRLMLSHKTVYSHLNNMKTKYRARSLSFLYLKIQNGELPDGDAARAH
ncbi:LuxR C-terminal-related transcriptional regulator [Erwinia tasmaniensis]|nr:LuxR family transcriptional regulator [Erwinia tasmaniensis]